MKRLGLFRRSRGFASIIAISLIPVVGLALAVLMQAIAADARRTSDAADAAQLRQLLTAASYVAAEEVKGQSSTSTPLVRVMDLPFALRNGGARVVVSFACDGQIATAHLVANLGRSGHAATRLRWEERGHVWALIAVEPGP